MLFDPAPAARSHPLGPNPCGVELALRDLLLDRVDLGLSGNPDSGLRAFGAQLLGPQRCPLAPIVELETTHCERILGLTAPAQFDAVVVTADVLVSNRTRSQAESHLGIAVYRSGKQLCLLANDEGISQTHQATGWLIDTCRRAVGLRTATTRSPPVDLGLAVWLDQILIGLMERTITDWDSAVGACPVPRRLKVGDPTMLGESLAAMAPSWSSLRSAACAGVALPVPIARDHAEWMDDSMFARWTLGFFPDLTDLRNDIEFLAPGPLAERIEIAIERARELCEPPN